MRVTIGHRKKRHEAVQIVDQSFDDLFRGLPIAPLQITDQHRSWNGPVMTFGLTAKMGFLQNPIRGTVEVTDREIIIDADLGFLERLISPGKFKTAVEESFQKLLPR
jgi:hypothetical protein